jgi:hypothetical protein
MTWCGGTSFEGVHLLRSEKVFICFSGILRVGVGGVRRVGCWLLLTSVYELIPKLTMARLDCVKSGLNHPKTNLLFYLPLGHWLLLHLLVQELG